MEQNYRFARQEGETFIRPDYANSITLVYKSPSFFGTIAAFAIGFGIIGLALSFLI